MNADRRVFGVASLAAWFAGALSRGSASANPAHPPPIVEVRTAIEADLDICVALVETSRRNLARYEPRFWRRATGAASATRAWFAHLLSDPQTIFLVACEAVGTAGFLVARVQPAPPVYDPGGPTALIDDFCVSSYARWRDVGSALLAEARARLRTMGVAQIVVIAPEKDRAKVAFLRAERLSLTSTWWTGQP